MKKMTKNPYPTKSPKLIIHARLFYFFPKKKHLTLPPQLFLCLSQSSFAPPWQALPPPPSSSQSSPQPESQFTPCIPLLQRSRPASAPAAPTAAAAGAAVRTASASSPSPSFLAPFLLLLPLPLPLPRLPGASRIHTTTHTPRTKQIKKQNHRSLLLLEYYYF